MTKRPVSILIPYRIKDTQVEVYLQKRSPDMERLPNYFAMWGGDIDDGETPEQGLAREAKEELSIDVSNYPVESLNKYEFLKSINHVFIFEAEPGFENAVVVNEGEYGKWFTAEEVFAAPNIIFETKVVVNDIERTKLNKSIR